MFEVEILSIGNELLIGKIADTNAQYLARRITQLGGRVTRITTVGDEVETIASAVKEALTRKPDFLLTTGGLGPTFDDKTLAGIAEALNLELRVDEEALRMVKQRYEKISAERGVSFELTPARVKMATIPVGGKPIRNPVGTAPAVRLKVGSTVLYALPGVPREMKAIFEESIAPEMASRSDKVFSELYLHVERMAESTLAPLIDKVIEAHPEVYVKSHPRAEEGKPYIELHLTIYSESLEEARRKLEEASQYLERLIEEKGGVVYCGGIET